MNSSHSQAVDHRFVFRRSFGELAYGSVFAVLLPVLLASWAMALDRRIELPALGSPSVGVAFALAGFILAVAAVIQLRVRGGAWPMSPFPPQRLVTSGVYALLAHPLYLGSILITFGVAMAFSSGAGIWVVAPVLTFACIAFVWGFEQERTNELLGDRPAPLLHLASPSTQPAATSTRVSFYFLALLPWYLMYEGVNRLQFGGRTISLVTGVDAAIPVIGWTELVYFLAYPIVLFAPIVAKTEQELRQLTIRSWIAIATSAVCYLSIPASYFPKPVPDTLFASLMEWERAFDARNTAFPAFHAIWPMLVMDVYARAFPRTRALRWVVVLAIAISCVTTGMHAVVDVAAGLLLGALFTNLSSVWRAVIRASEWLSASWAEWRIGPVRVINHGLYAGLAVAAGIAIATSLAGERHRLSVVVIALGIIAGAALWAQLIEGSSALLRPYGYYGGVIGGMATIAVLSIVARSGLLLLAAYAVAAPVIQALGRLRCIVQGCCHGRAADDAVGARVTSAKSRIVRLAGLSGVPLHATAVYSILMNLSFAALLFRLWHGGAPLSFIAGSYLILSGLERFVEEHYRGEPQTRVVAGLRLYQWLAIISLVAGAALTAAPSASAPTIEPVTLATAVTAAIGGIFAFFAYGADFPESNRRFSRLC